MKKKGQFYYFTNSEREIIKKLIDRKFGKITTPADYSSESEFNNGVPAEIYNYTNEIISGSTLERLVGLRDKEKRGTNESTIKIVSKYLEFRSLKDFSSYIDNQAKYSFIKEEKFSINKLFSNHQVFLQLKLNNDKYLMLKNLNENVFEIVKSKNLKLNVGYKVEINVLQIYEELIFGKVIKFDEDGHQLLGMYKSGYNNQVQEISFELKELFEGREQKEL